MSGSEILLILLSGLGVLHGLLLGLFLWFYTSGQRISNRILSFLLLVLSFRVGKSVILEFSDTIQLPLIFAGLATLMAIGPLFYFYTKSVLERAFRLSYQKLLHFVPALAGILFGLQVDQAFIDNKPVAVFALLFCVYYGHYLFYIFYSYILIRRGKAINHPATPWLSLLFYGLAAIWVVYVLNLIEEQVPYVLGPILYSLVAYTITFIALRKGYLAQIGSSKYQTTPVSDAEITGIYEKVKALISDKEWFKNSDITLSTISDALKTSPQKISMAINTRSGGNFNGFINHYRIEYAKSLMEGTKFRNHTIASIAFESGFNSLTSFNTAFKKETGKTPSAYRAEVVG